MSIQAYYALVVFLHGFRVWKTYYPWDHIFGPYTTILNVVDTLLLALIPAAQLYQRYRSLSVSNSDIATRVLQAKIWVNSICMCAFWVHCASAVSKVSDAMRLLTAKQLALVVFSLPGLVVFSIMASTWTYLILMFGLSQPQGPSAAAQREYQQCNGYADFWRNNRTRIGWLGCSFLIPREATAAAAAPAEGAPSPPKTPSSDTDAAPDFKAGVDSDGVHKTEG
ncbi:hypothetical protein AB1N83_008500 [Pleurotus pulmonarius]